MRLKEQGPPSDWRCVIDIPNPEYYEMYGEQISLLCVSNLYAGPGDPGNYYNFTCWLGDQTYPDLGSCQDACFGINNDANFDPAQGINAAFDYTGTTADSWPNCPEPPIPDEEEENICDNFESSIPVSVSEFCAKCETNSWIGSGYEQYCECCPAGSPSPEGTPPIKDKAPLKNKSKKIKRPLKLKESVVKRFQKLAGIKKSKK